MNIDRLVRRQPIQRMYAKEMGHRLEWDGEGATTYVVVRFPSGPPLHRSTAADREHHSALPPSLPCARKYFTGCLLHNRPIGYRKHCTGCRLHNRPIGYRQHWRHRLQGGKQPFPKPHSQNEWVKGMRNWWH